jgi:REP element-mobilizing transposase RayT
MSLRSRSAHPGYTAAQARSPHERSDMRGNAGPVARMSGAAVRGPTGFEVWGYHVAMVRYRRNRVDGGTYFFTVTLADRRSTAMVDHVSSLRTAFRVARQERPFALDAIVILPDHLHAILSLPEGDANFAGRWRRIKGHFSTACSLRGYLSAGTGTVSLHSGKGGFGSTRSVTSAISHGTWITSTIIL